jgi:hypothetical protein
MNYVQDGGFPPFFGLFAGLVSGVDRPDPGVAARQHETVAAILVMRV